MQMTPSLPTPTDAGLQKQIDMAITDLAQRLSISAAQINFLEVRQVTWPDASMGCPQPDMVYTQVPVEGLLVRLGVGKEMYLYHSSRTGDPFLCESTSPAIPNIPPKNDELIPPPDSEID
jgi:hypothetical protein